MAQDTKAKRLNIASRAVASATKLWDAAMELKQIAAERAVAGNFTDADFLESDLLHLTAFMIGSFIDTHIPQLVDAVDDHQQILLEVRR